LGAQIEWTSLKGSATQIERVALAYPDHPQQPAIRAHPLLSDYRQYRYAKRRIDLPKNPLYGSISLTSRGASNPSNSDLRYSAGQVFIENSFAQRT